MSFKLKSSDEFFFNTNEEFVDFVRTCSGERHDHRLQKLLYFTACIYAAISFQSRRQLSISLPYQIAPFHFVLGTHGPIDEVAQSGLDSESHYAFDSLSSLKEIKVEPFNEKVIQLISFVLEELTEKILFLSGKNFSTLQKISKQGENLKNLTLGQPLNPRLLAQPFLLEYENLSERIQEKQ